MDYFANPVATISAQSAQTTSGTSVVVTAKRPKDVADPRGLMQFSLNQAEISFLNPLNTSDLIEMVAVQAGVDRSRGFDGIVVNGVASRDAAQISRYPLDSILSVSVSSGEIASAAGFLPSELLLVVSIKPNYSQSTANLTAKGEESCGSQTIAEINRTVFTTAARNLVSVPSNRTSLNLKLINGSDPLSNCSSGDDANLAVDTFRYDVEGTFEQTKRSSLVTKGSVLTARLNLSGSETSRVSNSFNVQGASGAATEDISKNHRSGLELAAKFPSSTFNAEGRIGIESINFEQENFNAISWIAQASQSDTVRARWSLGGGRVIPYNQRVDGKSFYMGTSLDWSEDHRSNLSQLGFDQTKTRQVDRAQQSSIFMRLNINNIFAKGSPIQARGPSGEEARTRLSVLVPGPEMQRLYRFGIFNLNLRLSHRSQTRFEESISSTFTLNWQKVDWGMIANLTHTTSLEAASLELLSDVETQQIGPVFDYAIGQPVNATLISGRPTTNLTPQSQSDSFRLTWQPKFAERLRLNMSLNRRTSNNGLIAFPALTAKAEDLLPGRIVRDANGALVSVDLRAVQLAGTRIASMSFGFSTSIPFGASQSLGERLDETGGADLRMQGQLVSKNRLNLSMGYRTQLYDEVALSASGPIISRTNLAASIADNWRSNIDTLAVLTVGPYGLRLNSSLSFDNQSARQGSQHSQHSWLARASLNFDQLPSVIQRHPNLDNMFVYFEVATRPISVLRTDTNLLSTIDRYSEQSLADARGQRSVSIFSLGVRKSF
jgi:hypothetical protein